MKTTGLLAALLTISLYASAELRTFTTQDGRSLDAAVVDYNEAKGVVVVQREDGKKITVKPDAFTEEDQDYILKWYAAKVFLSETKFQLKLDDKKGETTKKEHEVDFSEQSGRRSAAGTQQVAVDQRTKYDINLTLKNSSSVPLHKIALEYRVFYKQQKAVKDEKANENRPEDSTLPERHMAMDELKVKEGTAKLKTAEPKSDRTVTPTTVTLMKRTVTSRPYGDKIN